MPTHLQDIQDLLQRYMDDQLSAPEAERLMLLIKKQENITDWEGVIEELASHYPSGEFSRQEWRPFINTILRTGQEREELAKNGLKPAVPVHRIHFLRRAWFRYAAVLLLVAGAVTFLYLNNRPQQETATGKITHNPGILPGGNKAILTLSDGSTIILDSAGSGTLASQGNTKILKLDAGAVAYQAGAAHGEILYNTISTPKGGQYQVTLADGSKVWLNAASSIRFPTSFTGSERRIEVKGEVYFEVAENTKMPFMVNINKQAEIKVLGTSFNVNAYEDETTIRTTLLEGAVKVAVSGTREQKWVMLKSGQQASVKTVQQQNPEIAVIDDADLSRTVAWKEGLFNFEEMNLREAMRQLERWYDIKVTYENGVPDIRFWGKIGRDVPLNGLLKMLKGSKLHFRMEEATRRLVIIK